MLWLNPLVPLSDLRNTYMEPLHLADVEMKDRLWK